MNAFQVHRNLLFTLAYDLLGSVADAEDVVQETWLRWSGVEHDRIGNPRAYLARVATRLALDVLRRRRAAKEDYVGPWLPEPLWTSGDGDPAGDVNRAQALAAGLMVVLESLSPLERAAFVLHEAFGFEHTEVAHILERSPAAVRQLVHRAREHVRARRPRFPAERAVAQAAAERFLSAAFGGSVGDLMEVLAPEVTLWTDGGGRVRSALRPVRGSGKVSRFLAQVVPTGRPVEIQWARDGGPPTALITADGAPLAVVVVVTAPGAASITELYGILNPDKLAHLSAPRAPD
ncbi:RNA polymerase sigma factor SigJ [Sinosporangium siamense]|uniref:RNA polymerase sigma24 factor n=1 Tax=Sinosporangium siamense TaxID=1367973 RepID=A0A919VAT1_9ACTN|nr:RNA polymerase sigma factor SigJ [Sinosporangium siamense]GII96826.1 RNA polymerase sigma24 factor [Sinosporangium siamense]